MATSLDPFTAARRDAANLARRVLHRSVDFYKTYVTLALLKPLGIGAVALVAGALNFPVFAFVVCAVAIVGLAVYAIYATKLLKAQDRESRWTWIAGKRVQQRELAAKIAVDTATLALMGERHAPGKLRGAAPELRSALLFHQRRLAEAEARAAAAEAVKEGTATDAQRRALKRFQRSDAPPPKGPDVEPIKRRREALEAERAALEAEIQSLATADEISKAMEDEEVQGLRRTLRERQDAARRADQAARERVRRGRTATAEQSEHMMSLEIRPNGARHVSSEQAGPTPERIAQGEDSS